MNIGETIRTLRREHGLSQEEMAEQFHVTRQSISNWENNRNYPDLETLLLISKNFNVSLDTLLDDDREYVRQNVTATKNSHRRKLIIIALTALVIIMLTAIVILVSLQERDSETASLNFEPTAHMSIGVGTVHNYFDDANEIAAITEMLSGNYATKKQVIIDPEKGSYTIQLWDDPDGVWEEIIVIDDKHIVYNGWKCKKIDAPIDLRLLENTFKSSP